MPARAFRLKAPPPPAEALEQAALFRWRDVAKKMEQGLTPGVSDVALLVPRGGYHGLLIELKRRDATPCRLSANQKGFIEFQRAQGYRAEWCKGWDAARNLVINYLEGKLC
ncbi:MAG: VRR-NUC domain-containing protein [Candidatus Competibacteraceae bacterium]|nr:VRR-NUC domain-containing protein [Candidatus Competibacteraceae bacterium]